MTQSAHVLVGCSCTLRGHARWDWTVATDKTPRAVDGLSADCYILNEMRRWRLTNGVFCYLSLILRAHFKSDNDDDLISSLFFWSFLATIFFLTTIENKCRLGNLLSPAPKPGSRTRRLHGQSFWQQLRQKKKGPQDLFFSPSTSNPVSKHFIENIVLRVCVALTRTKNAKKEKALIYKNNVVWPVEVAERKSE